MKQRQMELSFDKLKMKYAFLIMMTLLGLFSCGDGKGGEAKESSADSAKVAQFELDPQLQQFVPEDYVAIDLLSGDLNKDGETDYAIIIKGTDLEYLEKNDAGEMVDKNRRGIVIVFKDGDGYRKIVDNRTCFESENEEGGAYFAPELSMEINSQGNLSIDYGHGKYGGWGYIFRYQNNAFELIGLENYSCNGPVGLSKVSVNLSTKKKNTSINTKEDCESGEEVWVNSSEHFEIEPKPNLQDIDDMISLVNICTGGLVEEDIQ